MERSDLTLTVLHGPAGPEGAALAQEEPAAVAECLCCWTASPYIQALAVYMWFRMCF